MTLFVDATHRNELICKHTHTNIQKIIVNGILLLLFFSEVCYLYVFHLLYAMLLIGIRLNAQAHAHVHAHNHIHIYIE